MLEQYQWEPYGLLATKDTDTSGTIPHSHIGHQGLFFYRFDDSSGSPIALNAVGLYQNRNRWYSPTLGRFTSRDPNGTSQLVMVAMRRDAQTLLIPVGSFDTVGHFGDGINLFARVRGNPISQRDPAGSALQILAAEYSGGEEYAYGAAQAANASMAANMLIVAIMMYDGMLGRACDRFEEMVHGQYVVPPALLPAFPDAQPAKSKSHRKRWVDSKGNIYEWDYQHGAVEKYNKRGKHLGEYDPNTGEQTKPAEPGRETET